VQSCVGFTNVKFLGPCKTEAYMLDFDGKLLKDLNTGGSSAEGAIFLYE
jgi:hypothetical protein